PASARAPTCSAEAQPSRAIAEPLARRAGPCALAALCRRKCTPSTIASTEVAQTPRPRTTAASSPIPRSSRPSPPGSADSTAAIASIRARSAMPVDDPRAVQVVGRELAAHAVARQDADPEATHLAGHVTEHDVIVVELDPEHRVGQRLDHLALEFDLVF